MVQLHQVSISELVKSRVRPLLKLHLDVLSILLELLELLAVLMLMVEHICRINHTQYV